MGDRCLDCGKTINQPRLGRRRLRCDGCAQKLRAAQARRRRAAHKALAIMTASGGQRRELARSRKGAQIYSAIALMSERVNAVNAACIRLSREAAPVDCPDKLRDAINRVMEDADEMNKMSVYLRSLLGSG